MRGQNGQDEFPLLTTRDVPLQGRAQYRRTLMDLIILNYNLPFFQDQGNIIRSIKILEHLRVQSLLISILIGQSWHRFPSSGRRVTMLYTRVEKTHSHLSNFRSLNQNGLFAGAARIHSWTANMFQVSPPSYTFNHMTRKPSPLAPHNPNACPRFPFQMASSEKKVYHKSLHAQKRVPQMPFLQRGPDEEQDRRREVFLKKVSQSSDDRRFESRGEQVRHCSQGALLSSSKS